MCVGTINENIKKNLVTTQFIFEAVNFISKFTRKQPKRKVIINGYTLVYKLTYSNTAFGIKIIQTVLMLL